MGEGVLTLERVPLRALADAVGTPFYAYSAGHIRTQFQRLGEALAPVPHRICYSAKANGNLAVLHLLRTLGSGVDIVSGGELARARAAGFGGADMVFSGVGKTVAELEHAITAGVGMINVESDEELTTLADVARRLGRTAPVAVRVNPEVLVDTHPYTATGMKGQKFGVPYDDAEAVAARAADLNGVELLGLAMHIGSGVTAVEPFVDAVERMTTLVAALRARGVTTLTTLDLGGGLGITYRTGDEPIDVAEYARAVLPHVAATGLTLVVEPGRFLVGNAGVLATRVLYRKRSGGRMIAIVDAGMTDLIRPSHYQAWHDITVDGAAGRPEQAWDVVGPICESGDFLALERVLPDLEAGDLVVIGGAGAYGFTMSSHYNARPRPPELLVDDDRWAIIRERESVEDLMRGEWVDPEWKADG